MHINDDDKNSIKQKPHNNNNNNNNNGNNMGGCWGRTRLRDDSNKCLTGQRVCHMSLSC